LSKDFSYTTGGTSVKMGFGLLSAFRIILDAEHRGILRADNKAIKSLPLTGTPFTKGEFQASA